MKLSIRKKFFLIFIIILLISELSILLLSNLFLDDIVISANKILIKNMYKENVAYFHLDDINEDKLNDLSSQNDLGIVIYDNGTLDSCSSLFLCRGNDTELPTYITNYFSYVNKKEDMFQIIDLKILNVNRLVYISNIGDGKYVIIDKALHSIQEINQIINQFVLVSSFSIFIIGSLIILAISRKITKPIIGISQFAKDIANLKFDKQLDITNQDEIGQLAKNMNLIAERLNIALKELNEKNKILKEDLEKEKELDRRRVKFFSTVSHEFKTPLTIIQGYADGIKNKIVSSPEDLNDYCDIIIEESKKMTQFVNDLLNLSKYESENFSLTRTNFDIVKLINFIANKFNDSMKNKNVEFIIDGMKQYMIHADKHRIEQVVYNLLSNAAKHVEDKGIIKITIKDLDDSVKVLFYNDGEKIDEKELENIWNLFYKLDNNKNLIGTGIGLSIVKSIVDLHNGTYGVENKDDGVEFFFKLPKHT